MTSVIIPTLNPGRQLQRLVDSLLTQESAALDLIVIDSGSTDGTPEYLSKANVKYINIPRSDFHHAKTRNLAASKATGEVLVFMTQDALPIDNYLIAKLEGAIAAGAAAAFARHVAKSNATPLESYARTTNYPISVEARENAQTTSGIRTVFFSNACSAIRRDVFTQLGGFPTHTIMNEDMIFATRLIRSGYSIAYVPDALVQHSHTYTILDTFKRYFDIGVVFEQAREDLAARDVTSEGLRYVRGLFTTLWRDRDYAWIPVAFAESAAKWVGTYLGRRYKHLPSEVVKRLSMHRSYWDRTH